MNLATFILTNLENILEKWEAARRPESHPRQVESPGIRRDDAGELLRAIARDLEASRTSGQREVAKPDRSYARLDIEAAADRHGTGRAKLGFTLDQMIAEFPLLRSCVTSLWLVQAAADEVTTSHPERSVHIEVSGDLHGKWDPRRIGQALSNLLGNAVHHGQPKTTIDVLAHGDGVEVSLAVHNEGAPIPPERRTAIFDPLSTPDERERLRAHDPDHLGLGLYITREIVRSHHGRIDIDSSADRGTTFTIHLPRESADTR